MKFTKFLSRLSRTGDGSPRKSSSTSKSSSPGFHQLTSRRDPRNAKRLPKSGSGRIVATSHPPKAAAGHLPSDHNEGEGSRDGDGQTQEQLQRPPLGSGSDIMHVADELQSSTICPVCQSIDFPRLLDWKPGDPRPWVSLSHCLEDSECPFCIFFQNMVGDVGTSQSQEELAGRNYVPYLRIRLAFERIGGLQERTELGQAVLIEVTTKSRALPWGYLVKAAAGADQVRDAPAKQDGVQDDDTQDVSSPMADYTGTTPRLRGRTVTPMLNRDLPRGWLDYCKSHHEELGCNNPDTSTLDRIWLIDCEDKIMVSSADLAGPVEYATVSFAGDDSEDCDEPSQQQANDEDPQLPHNLPQGMLDAMSLSSSLGYRYLWTDLYCMPHELSQRHSHLTGMGEIFSRSQITLIVTGARSISDGICGISIARDEQLSLLTDAGLYTTTLLRPDAEVSLSSWASQARTYQAGLLSRRRLVLTSSQVYFQCQCLHCQESLAFPLDMALSVNTGRAFPERKAVYNTGEIKNHIKDFIRKDVAQPQDRLDAFKGVLGHYQRSLKVHSILGLPMFNGSDLHGDDTTVNSVDQLCVGLGWVADRTVPYEGYIVPFMYEPGCFPSWTWLSWRLKKEATPWLHFFYFNIMDDDMFRSTKGSSASASPTKISLQTTQQAQPTASAPSKPLVTEKTSQTNGIALQNTTCIVAAPRLQVSMGLSDGTILSWQQEPDKIKAAETEIAFLRLETWCFEIPIQLEGSPETTPGPGVVSLPNSVLDSSCQDAIKAWATDSMLSRQQSSEPLPSAVYSAVGILIAGKGWNNEAQRGSVASVLVCAREGWVSSGKYQRLGALRVPFFGLEQLVDGETAVMKTVTISGKVKRNIMTKRRQIDLY